MDIFYKQAIDVLMNGNLGANEYKQIVVTLAKENPELFMKIVTPTVATASAPKWHHEIYNALTAGNKVEAIKTLRIATGYGLKEAKDIIDQVTDYMASRGRTPLNYSHSTNYLSPELNKIKKSLLVFIDAQPVVLVDRVRPVV